MLRWWGTDNAVTVHRRVCEAMPEELEDYIGNFVGLFIQYHQGFGSVCERMDSGHKEHER